MEDNPYQPPAFHDLPGMGDDPGPNSGAPALSEVEIRAFVGKRADYYLRKWLPTLETDGRVRLQQGCILPVGSLDSVPENVPSFADRFRNDGDRIGRRSVRARRRFHRRAIARDLRPHNCLRPVHRLRGVWQRLVSHTHTTRGRANPSRSAWTKRPILRPSLDGAGPATWRP